MTVLLHDDMYLRELDRQAAVFNRSFGDAMDASALPDGADETWRHLQSALFAAIVVSRLVDPRDVRGWPGVSRNEARSVAKSRAARLRRYVELPDPANNGTPIYGVREVRDAMEHIDERLDRVAHGSASKSMSDWYLSDGLLLVTLSGAGGAQTPYGLRAFVPEAGTLFFNDRPLGMFQLDLDMLALRNNIAEARSELRGRLTGRFTFGGSQLVEYMDEPTRRAAMSEWKKERAGRLDALLGAGGAGVDDRD